MNFEGLYQLVEECYNSKYSELYGVISNESAKVYCQLYGEGFIDWLKSIDDYTASEVVLFAIAKNELARDKIIEELERSGKYEEEHQSIETSNISLRESSNIIEF